MGVRVTSPVMMRPSHRRWYRPKPWWHLKLDSNLISLDFALIWFTDSPAAEFHASIACVHLNCGLDWSRPDDESAGEAGDDYLFNGHPYGPDPALPQMIRERIARLAAPASWHRHCQILHDRVGIDLALSLDHKESWFEAHCLIGPIDASAIRMMKLD